MLNYVNLEILKRARPPYSTFNFSSASIGNLFLTGARLFTGSFESAIYLLGVVGGVDERVNVIPVVNSMFSHHISAGLLNGETIAGQNAISHPSAPSALPNRHSSAPTYAGLNEDEPEAEDANLPGSLPTLRQPSILFSKSEEEDLPARIERIWYINPYGQEIHPAANPRAVNVLKGAEAVVYSIGSLYTSIIPCLILRDMGRGDFHFARSALQDSHSQRESGSGDRSSSESDERDRFCGSYCESRRAELWTNGHSRTRGVE